MWYAGVDVGKKGGFALIDSETQNAEVHLWDDEAFVRRMRELKSTGNPCVVCVEKVGAMPGNGSVSMFKFGCSAGFIQGVLSALEIPFQLVPPRTWKKDFSLDNDKQKSIETAQRLFPGVNFLPTERSRKPSDGMAEAALICLFASRHF